MCEKDNRVGQEVQILEGTSFIFHLPVFTKLNLTKTREKLRTLKGVFIQVKAQSVATAAKSNAKWWDLSGAALGR